MKMGAAIKTVAGYFFSFFIEFLEVTMVQIVGNNTYLAGEIP